MLSQVRIELEPLEFYSDALLFELTKGSLNCALDSWPLVILDLDLHANIIIFVQFVKPSTHTQRLHKNTRQNLERQPQRNKDVM